MLRLIPLLALLSIGVGAADLNRPLLIDAARNGDRDALRALLQKKADVNATEADVVKVLLAHGANVQARTEAWNEVMAVPPHGLPEYNKTIPNGSDTALLFAARVGDLTSAKLLVAAGANVNDADAWGVSATSLAAHSGYTEMVDYLLDKGADPNAAPAGFTALHEAIMRRDEKMVSALLDHDANANTPLTTWTPTRRASADFHFEPQLVGATPFWLAARFIQPAVMRLLLKHRADPLIVHHSEYVIQQGFQHRKNVTTALMAATGMVRAAAGVEAPRCEREALVLEAVKLAEGLGVDVNAADTDGRTALDNAKTLRYDSTLMLLV